MRLLITAAALAATAGPACPDEPPAADPARYYLLLFGGQAVARRPQTAHTWATFVRATPRPGGLTLETFTISWLPEAGEVRPFRPHTEPGRNYGLHETLARFRTGEQELGLWGPWEIRGDWYRQAAAYKQVLDGGAVRFKTFDGGPRRPNVSHCVHAITRTDEALRRAANPVTWYGELITRKVATAMDRVGLLVDPAITHDWLIPALGIEGFPFTRRRLGERVLFQ